MNLLGFFNNIFFMISSDASCDCTQRVVVACYVRFIGFFYTQRDSVVGYVGIRT